MGIVKFSSFLKVTTSGEGNHKQLQKSLMSDDCDECWLQNWLNLTSILANEQRC